LLIAVVLLAATQVAIWAGAQGQSVASLDGFVARDTRSVLSEWVSFRRFLPSEGPFAGY
jgi:hypothetical protein